MKHFRLLVLATAVALGGCTGLTQFPDAPQNYNEDLKQRDPNYWQALEDVHADGLDADEQRRIRNEVIDKRLAGIDANFKEFETALIRENVAADFGVAVVQVGVGGAGALVSETASQILSAVSGGLAGAQQAYTKAALFDKALSALLAQMIASRRAMQVRIYDGRARSIDEYPMSAAMHDLDAYYFAGSLPGAIIATSADAQVKKDAAERKLDEFKRSTFSEDENAKKIGAFIWPPDGDRSKPPDDTNLNKLRDWMKTNNIDGLSIQKLLDNPALKEERKKAVTDIPIR